MNLRKLNDEDFNNDRKDAGDLGSGHTVTALYEIIPVGVKSEYYHIDELKYQRDKSESSEANGNEWLTVKLRYKVPGQSTSNLLEHNMRRDRSIERESSEDFRWSACVAAFGMLLRDSQYAADLEHKDIIDMAQKARGWDAEGYRSEFISIVKSHEVLSKTQSMAYPYK